MVRLAQALYAAETTADEAAAAGPVAEPGRAPDAQAAGADPPPHVKAVELVLHARAELEVRARRSCCFTSLGGH